MTFSLLVTEVQILVFFTNSSYKKIHVGFNIFTWIYILMYDITM